MSYRENQKTRFQFGTKAETLERLKKRLFKSTIPEFIYFNVERYFENTERVFEKILQKFGEKEVIIRSSACSEDGERTAMAGTLDSISNVKTGDVKRLREAIEKVIASYGRVPSLKNQKNQVLIQEMISEVSMSGVVFTQDMNTGAPYYVINYDDQTGLTDTVTSGSKNSNKTLFVHRKGLGDLYSKRFIALISAVQEVEKITETESLDIEFAVDMELDVYLFQARRITTQTHWNRGLSHEIDDSIRRVQSFISQRHKKIPGVYGARSIYGQMPDWNPAEMIGSAPRPLSLSVYRYLITDSAWRLARKQMGYAEPRGSELMVSLAGRPYIDARLSFHSFLPCDLNAPEGEKLVNLWIDYLSENHELHDKIEFEIAITAMSFDFEETIKKRYHGELSVNEKNSFQNALHLLTNNLITGKISPIDAEIQKIRELERRRTFLIEECSEPNLNTVSSLLEDCIPFGTIPFSVLARHAFIARSFLNSMNTRGVLDESDIAAFQRSIKTVAGDVVSDTERLKSGDMTAHKYLLKYGHLRPGTYDILSPRYDQRKELVVGLAERPPVEIKEAEFSFSKKQLKDIESLLKEYGYDIEKEEFITYLIKAFQAREYAKFVFTKNLSDGLEIIADWGKGLGLSREEISFLTYRDVLDSKIEARGRSLEQFLRTKATEGKKDYEITKALRLPYIIDHPEDITVIPLLINRPNFITDKTVRGEYFFISGHDSKPSNVDGKIIIIEGADPGYDWIFSCSPGALITKYGGTNSHMAIRCAEFGLPAAIGCGEQIFERILRSRLIEINCSEGRVEPIVW